ncbi:MAG: aldehyde dehydrogenase family protein [Phycisphaerales bacterium JB043]
MRATEFLATGPANHVGVNTYEIAGDAIRSHNPARPAETIWQGTSDLAHVAEAVEDARKAFNTWSATPLEQRIRVLQTYKELLARRVDDFAMLISLETGKALWDSKGEAGILAGKVDITLEDAQNSGRARITGYEVAVNETRRGVCSFRPHGVMAVVGPFNFPAHLPNGHIIPALLAGNTVVFKPSDKTPAVGQLLSETIREALAEHDMPVGVVNTVHGEADVASTLVAHDGIDGILFTGSWPVGRKILEANLDNPGRIIALEMGGNNPSIVMDSADIHQALVETARCSFVTTGQRCTCTRRIIVHEGIADEFIERLCDAARSATVGDPLAEPPNFIGPIIREESQSAVLRYAEEIVAGGGELLVEPYIPEVEGCEDGHFITPGVARVDEFTCSQEGPVKDAGCDTEVFGPLVRVSVVDSFQEALAQANATRFGLSSSLFSSKQSEIDAFLRLARAGCVNINAGTAGASSKLPFGGLGISGNHRPAGSFALDYCAYPVASMIESGDACITPPGISFERQSV